MRWAPAGPFFVAECLFQNATGNGSEADVRQSPLEAQIEALIGPTVQGLGFELIRIRMMGPDSKRTLQIMAERPDGSMDVEGCAEISRVVSAVLDVEDPIKSAYELEVSSPGLDRPLTRLKDFEAFAGRQAKIELAPGVQGRRRYKGTLCGVEGDLVQVDAQGEDGSSAERFELPFADISEAKLIVTEADVRAAMRDQDMREQERIG